MLRDRTTQELREVDVVIETAVADSQVLISIECCKLGRPATVEWVERMICKHADLPTDRLILVARSGFTKQASAKALKHGIEALTVDEARQVPWTSALDRLRTVYFDATDVQVLVYADTEPAPGKLEGLVDTKAQVLSHDGVWRPQVRQVVDALLRIEHLRQYVLARLAEGDDSGYVVEFPVAPGTRILSPAGQSRDVSILKVVLLFRRRRYPLPVQTGQFRSYRVGWAEADGDFGKLTLSVLEREGEAPSALIVRRQSGAKGIIRVSGSAQDDLDPAPNEAMRAILRSIV
jgi:hypothetical protein